MAESVVVPPTDRIKTLFPVIHFFVFRLHMFFLPLSKAKDNSYQGSGGGPKASTKRMNVVVAARAQNIFIDFDMFLLKWTYLFFPPRTQELGNGDKDKPYK